MLNGTSGDLLAKKTDGKGDKTVDGKPETENSLRKQLEGDPTLQDVWVEGEISNLSRPASGHIYFTLKDKNASLRCVMWKLDAGRLRMNMQDGMAIEAHGSRSVRAIEDNQRELSCCRDSCFREHAFYEYAAVRA